MTAAPWRAGNGLQIKGDLFDKTYQYVRENLLRHRFEAVPDAELAFGTRWSTTPSRACCRPSNRRRPMGHELGEFGFDCRDASKRERAFGFGVPQRSDSTWLFISLALEKLRPVAVGSQSLDLAGVQSVHGDTTEPFLVREGRNSMPVPHYRPEQFIASGRDDGTPEGKARFVNALLRFIADGFPETRFTRSLYLGLTTRGSFGFIAHFDIHGFYVEQLSTPDRQTRFLRHLAWSCERDDGMDRPDLWTDVKSVLTRHLPT